MFRSAHYRTSLIACAAALVSICAAPHLFTAPRVFAANKSAPPAKAATEYPAHDTHPDEQVTIAADPCLDAKDCPFFRAPYLEHNFLPMRVIFTNDSDRALSLDDARIQLITSDNQKIQAATDDDLNRRLFTVRNTQPIYIPGIPIPIHRTTVDKKLSDDDADFGFSGTVVNAHSTLAGYIFYDIQGLDHPLKGAQLYVKMVHSLDGKKDLFAFTVPFDKWLSANPQH